MDLPNLSDYPMSPRKGWISSKSLKFQGAWLFLINVPNIPSVIHLLLNPSFLDVKRMVMQWYNWHKAMVIILSK